MKIGRKEEASTEVANVVSLCKCNSNVARGRLAIAVNAFGTDDCIERFKDFGREKHGSAKTTDMFWQVQSNVKFGFVEPRAGPTGGYKKKVLDFGL